LTSKKGGIQFIKTTVLGGLVFLVPVVVLIIVLAKAAGFMMMVAEPLAAWIPIDNIGGVAVANVFAIVSVLLVCFLAGLVARATLLRTTIEGLESKVLSKVPGYVIVKGMLSGLQQNDTHKLFPVLATFSDAARIGLEIERLDDGRIVVMVPTAPNPWSGKVHIMAREQVQRIDLPMTAYMENVERFGQGTGDLLRSLVESQNPEGGEKQ
jgi:uncharacterized membrane protein